jgi:hypothetical protein
VVLSFSRSRLSIFHSGPSSQTGRGYRRAFRCAPAGRQGRSTWVQLQCAGVSSSSCDGEGVEGASVVAQGRTRAQLGNMKTGVHLLSSPLALRIRLATRASSPLAPSRGRRTTSFTGRTDSQRSRLLCRLDLLPALHSLRDLPIGRSCSSLTCCPCGSNELGEANADAIRTFAGLSQVAHAHAPIPH